MDVLYDGLCIVGNNARSRREMKAHKHLLRKLKEQVKNGVGVPHDEIKDLTKLKTHIKKEFDQNEKWRFHSLSSFNLTDPRKETRRKGHKTTTKVTQVIYEKAETKDDDPNKYQVSLQFYPKETVLEIYWRSQDTLSRLLNFTEAKIELINGLHRYLACE